MVSTFVIAALLAAVAVGTFAWQVKAWRQQQQADLANFESEFYARRHRRRLQVSGLLALVAAAMVGGQWVHDPLVTGFYWLGVLLLLLWIILLATIDAAASHAFFSRLRSRHLAEQAALHQEVRQKRERGNQPP